MESDPKPPPPLPPAASTPVAPPPLPPMAGVVPVPPPQQGMDTAQAVFDTVVGPNVRLRDNLIQLACVVAGGVLEAGGGWLFFGRKGDDAGRAVFTPAGGVITTLARARRRSGNPRCSGQGGGYTRDTGDRPPQPVTATPGRHRPPPSPPKTRADRGF